MKGPAELQMDPALQLGWIFRFMAIASNPDAPAQRVPCGYLDSAISIGPLKIISPTR
jgi:hypothetical protein